MVRVIFCSLILIYCLYPGVVLPAEMIPIFDNPRLTIPVIDTPAKPGKYQNVEFDYSEQEGWQLVNYYHGFYRGILEVNTIVTDSFPIQVFLNIQGMGSSCRETGPVRYRFNGNMLEIFIYTLIPDDIASTACTAQTKSFSEYIPLPVYGLETGEYNYIVNEEFTGTFTLDEDNSF